MSNLQVSLWEQDQLIERKIKIKNWSLILNKSNVKGRNWKKNQKKKQPTNWASQLNFGTWIMRMR